MAIDPSNFVYYSASNDSVPYPEIPLSSRSDNTTGPLAAHPLPVLPHLYEHSLRDHPDLPLANARTYHPISKPAPPAGAPTPPKKRERSSSPDAASASSGHKSGGVPLNMFMFFKSHVARMLIHLLGTTDLEGPEDSERGQDKKWQRRQRPKKKAKKPWWRDMRQVAKLTSIIWRMLSPQVKAVWKTRLEDARRRCEDEAGHGIEGHGKEYLVEGLPEDIVPEDILSKAVCELGTIMNTPGEDGARLKKRKTATGAATTTTQELAADRNVGKLPLSCRTKAPQPLPEAGSTGSHDRSQLDTPSQSSTISASDSADEYFDVEALEKLLALPTAHDITYDGVDLVEQAVLDDVHHSNDIAVFQELAAQGIAMHAVPVHVPQAAYGTEDGPSRGWAASQPAGTTAEACGVDDALFNYVVQGGHVFGNPSFTFAFDFASTGRTNYAGGFEHESRPFVPSTAYSCSLPSSWTDANHHRAFEHEIEPFVPSSAYGHSSSSSSSAHADETLYSSVRTLAGPSSITAHGFDAPINSHLDPRGHFGPQDIYSATSYAQHVPVIEEFV